MSGKQSHTFTDQGFYVTWKKVMKEDFLCSNTWSLFQLWSTWIEIQQVLPKKVINNHNWKLKSLSVLYCGGEKKKIFF